MAGQVRLNASGILHFIMTQGIESRKIFWNATDYEDFLDHLARRMTDIFNIKKDVIFAKNNQGMKVTARSMLCYWAVREVGFFIRSLAKRLGMSVPGVGYTAERGAAIVLENQYDLLP